MGGRKTVGNLRRVQINDSEQERQFFAVVDSDEWMGDSVTSLWGAQGVSPETLTREHKEDLKDLVDRDLLEIVETPADDDAVASGADPTVAPE
jgi:tRNA A37 threonylcarbamoyltransferase TsaD